MSRRSTSIVNDSHLTSILRITSSGEVPVLCAPPTAPEEPRGSTDESREKPLIVVVSLGGCQTCVAAGGGTVMRASLIARSFEAMAPVDTITKYPRLFRHKLGTVVIPEDLRARLSGALKNYPRASLVQNAKVLAEVLRQRVRARPSDASAGVIKPRVMLRYDRDETFTYLAHRVPGIYATAFRVFREAAFKLPTFAPESVLDYGSGPGTALMAARVVWPAMQKAVAIEPSSEMESAAVKLMADTEGLTVERRRYLIKDVEKQHELVIASYSLGEVQDPIERTEVVKLLWSLVADDGGVLVLIEPGTPVGFKTINDARTLVLQRKANLIAPCPHAHACPMPNTSWCHFKQRIRKATTCFCCVLK
jgi:ribosomal protein RSM22 (predicted rRNA methylase)